MNPTIQPIKMPTGRSYYLVTFATIADRTRWLKHNDFHYHPVENCQARWISDHNGSDFTHKLEIIPFDPDHSNNPRALCMRVYLMKVKEEVRSIELPKPPTRTTPPKPESEGRSPKGSFGGKTAQGRELDLPVYLRYAKS